MNQSVLTVIAGPNGAGKSTIYRRAKPEGHFINADEIEASLPSEMSKPDRERAAGRVALEAVRHMLSTGQSFVVETTLAGRWPLKLMADASTAGYRVELVYVCLDSPQRSIERVAFRVRGGGHDIPTDAILRRYPRSLANLKSAARLADEYAIIDNSARKPRFIFKFSDGSFRDINIVTALDEQIYLSLVR